MLVGNTELITAPVRHIDAKVEALIASTGAKLTFRSNDVLKGITLDRTSESKFFGFGIYQKVNVKLLDIDRAYDFTTNDIFNIYFNDVLVSPRMRVSEVHRDENTNELSITAYDLLNETTKYTVADLGLSTSYTIRELATATALKLGVSAVLPALSEFNLSYAEGANFDGTETLHAVLDAIAEATQTVYYMNAANQLVFKRLDKDGLPALTIGKEQYISLNTKTNRRLTAIGSITELGDNYEASTGLAGTTQYVRDNPLWELREDVATLVDNALSAMGNITINQFDCSWRGNYLAEPGDKLALITKDNNEVYSYLLNDTIKYDGSYSQHTMWEYTKEEDEQPTNPTSLGETLKQTYAKVDKANKRIELVSSDTSSALGSMNDELVEVSKKVSTQITPEQMTIAIQKEISNGTSKVETATGFTFNEQGLTVSKTGKEMTTQITEDGMTVARDGNKVLIADNTGVKAENLHATTYLIIGETSRFEDFEGRTCCFWIGG